MGLARIVAAALLAAGPCACASPASRGGAEAPVPPATPAVGEEAVVEEVAEGGAEGEDPEVPVAPRPAAFRRAPKPCVGLAAPGETRTVDVNSDGAVDVWEVTRGGVRYCRETDLNFDGRPDLVTFYDADGREETRREMDLDFDGEADVIEVRVGGMVHRMTIERTPGGP